MQAGNKAPGWRRFKNFDRRGQQHLASSGDLDEADNIDEQIEDFSFFVYSLLAILLLAVLLICTLLYFYFSLSAKNEIVANIDVPFSDLPSVRLGVETFRSP